MAGVLTPYQKDVEDRIAELADDKVRDVMPAGTEMVMPGDNVSVTVNLIAPVAMEEGLRFAIREGGRTVGAGVVAKIVA